MEAEVTGYGNIEEARRAGNAEDRIITVPGTTEDLAAVHAGRADIGAMTAVRTHEGGGVSRGARGDRRGRRRGRRGGAGHSR